LFRSGWTPDDIYLLAGTNLLDTGGTAYNVSKIIKHQDFNTTTIWNDIALIKIEGKFEFTDVVKTIGIGEVSGGQSSTIVGWGSTKDGDPNEQQYTEVTTLTPDDCAQLAEAAPYNLERGPGQVCALGSVDVGPCHGDSGGPLLFNNTVVGMVSYALDPACAKGYPDIYTRAAYYAEWIDESISLY
jgi:trypsin